MNLVKILARISLLAFLASCGGESSSIKTTDKSDASIASATSNPAAYSSNASNIASSLASNSSNQDSNAPSNTPVKSASSGIPFSSTNSMAAAPNAKPKAMQTDRWYVFSNRDNGLALDIAKASKELGAGLIQWTRTGNKNQQFRFVDSGNNYYRIVARHSNLPLDLYNFVPNSGADIVQWEDLNGVNQQFQALDLSNGYYQFSNRLSGKVLSPEFNANVGGTRITQYSPSAALAQQWQLLDAGAYTTGECGTVTAKARVTGQPGNYQMNGRDFGSDYRGAIYAALDELTPGRTQQERVTIMASGDVGDGRINLKSHTVFEVCGTIHAAPTSRGTVTIWGSETEDIAIPYLKITGTTSFALLIADTHNLHLGQIDLRLNGGAGIRFDKRGLSTNVTIDSVYVEGTSGHGVETWNIDGLEIGSVVARNTGYAGLLLNNTRNAKIGTVDGINTGTGTGYATLRFANTNGRINNQYPTNIYVDKLISRGGGRGLFCVSNSGGVEINHIDLADNGSNSALIENCHNVTIKGGTIQRGGEFRLAARAEFPNTSNISVSNLRVTNASVRESPCGNNIKWINLTVTGGSRKICN